MRRIVPVVIRTALDSRSPEFRANFDHHRALAQDLRRRMTEVAEASEVQARERLQQQGKLPVRERIDRILDSRGSFLELSTLAAQGVYPDATPGAGVVTGIGRVHKRDVLFVANDPTVKGGTYLPLSVKKHLRAQEIALENRLPCVYLVDSGGAFLPEQAEVFPDRFHFGRIFYNQARLSAAGIAQISAVLGSCTAGGAYVPAMSDETVIVRGTGTIFIAGPPLVKAATGEDVDAEALGGASIHARESGVADHLAEDEPQALSRVREIIATIPSTAPEKWAGEVAQNVQGPAYAADELYGVIPADPKVPYDVREVIARLVDRSGFSEFKALYGTNLVCGFAQIHGRRLGIVANNGVLQVKSSEKGAHFIQLCGQRRIPILFLQNISGFMVGARYEAAGIARAGAKMVHAVATCGVPRLTLVIGGSHGAGNYAMCGRGYDPRFLWMWPNARISVMGAEQAAEVLVSIKAAKALREGRTFNDKEARRVADPIRKKYEKESSAYFSSARLWDDGVIDPIQTRDIIGIALSIVTNSPIGEMRPGVFRM